MTSLARCSQQKRDGWVLQWSGRAHRVTSSEIVRQRRIADGVGRALSGPGSRRSRRSSRLKSFGRARKEAPFLASMPRRRLPAKAKKSKSTSLLFITRRLDRVFAREIHKAALRETKVIHRPAITSLIPHSSKPGSAANRHRA